jgi:hypothetical protein
MSLQPSSRRRPDSSGSLEQIADTLLRRAGALGTIPTPIDDLVAAARLEDAHDLEPFVSRFLSRIAANAREAFLATLQKVRGIADLRERAIYIPTETSQRRRRFVQAHELGHQVIPWHSVNVGYRDDDLSLTGDAQELFDIEANFFAAEVMFQGKRFRNRVRDYAPSFDAVFQLADEHEASRHATLWRFVEEQDEIVCAVTFWPSIYTVDSSGHAVLRRGKIVASPTFLAKFGDLALPRELPATHPWVQARNERQPCEGDIKLTSGTDSRPFQWQAWWNSYCLFVLLRRRPALSLVGDFIRQ